jgi:hypothetical protein
MRSPILFSLPKSALQVSKLNRPLLYKTSKMSTGIPSQAPVSTAAADSITENRAGGSSAGISASDLGIENTNISTAAGVNLNERQRVVVGSVLDVCSLHSPPSFPYFPHNTRTNPTQPTAFRRPPLPQKTLPLVRHRHLRRPAHHSRRPQTIRRAMVRSPSGILFDRAYQARGCLRGESDRDESQHEVYSERHWEGAED